MTRMFFSILVLLLTSRFCFANETHVISLFVGVNNNLKANTKDEFAGEAVKVHSALCENKLYKTDSRLLLGKNATRQGLLDEFAWILSKANKDTLVFIYLSAHGGIDNQNYYYCCMSDDNVYGYELQYILDRLPCRVIFVVDTCHAGAFVDNWSNSNVFVIAACRSEEKAGVWCIANPFAEAVKLGDANGNDVIDSEELFDYLDNHNSDQHVIGSNHFKIDLMKANHLEGCLHINLYWFVLMLCIVKSRHLAR